MMLDPSTKMSLQEDYERLRSDPRTAGKFPAHGNVRSALDAFMAKFSPDCLL